MSKHDANVPIPTANDVNNINNLNSIGQSNIYVIDENGNDIQPIVDSGTDRLLVDTLLDAALNGDDQVEIDLQATSTSVTTQLDQIGGQAQSAVDVADKIDQIEDALVSVGTDEIRVTSPNPLDVSAATVTVTDNGSFGVNSTPLDVALNGSQQLDVDLAANSAGTLDVEQQSPVGVEDSQGTQIDPLARQDTSPVTGSTSTAGTDVTLTLGDYRKDVDFFVDVNGSATLTVEVRTSGGTWRPFDTVTYQSAKTEVEQYSTAFAEIRASVDQNLNTLEGSAKGV